MTTPIHYKLADLLVNLIAKGANRRTYAERANGPDQYESGKHAESSFVLNQEIAIVDLTIYNGLKLNAIRLLIRIQQELKINNPLWECKDKNKSEVRSGLAQLKAADIIEPLAGTDMFIVNPEKIRRGKPLTVLAALYQYCKARYSEDKKWRISNADIRRLQAPENTRLMPEI